MMAWKPIDTAPKDGVPVLLYELAAVTSEVTSVFVGKWRDGQWLTNPGNYKKKPTHWHPLPAKPDSDHVASVIRRRSVNDS